jgi:uncharacterized DUF497 family protein
VKKRVPDTLLLLNEKGFLMNYDFEWNPNKAKSNIEKHKISFEDAASVFKDENAISIYDEEHSLEEDRWVTIGMDFTRSHGLRGNAYLAVSFIRVDNNVNFFNRYIFHITF